MHFPSRCERSRAGIHQHAQGPEQEAGSCSETGAICLCCFLRPDLSRLCALIYASAQVRGRTLHPRPFIAHSPATEYPTCSLRVLSLYISASCVQGLDVGDRAVGADIHESQVCNYCGMKAAITCALWRPQTLKVPSCIHTDSRCSHSLFSSGTAYILTAPCTLISVQHASRHRWEAVQRLSGILHEVHDAEVHSLFPLVFRNVSFSTSPHYLLFVRMIEVGDHDSNYMLLCVYGYLFTLAGMGGWRACR